MDLFSAMATGVCVYRGIGNLFVDSEQLGSLVAALPCSKTDRIGDAGSGAPDWLHHGCNTQNRPTKSQASFLHQKQRSSNWATAILCYSRANFFWWRATTSASTQSQPGELLQKRIRITLHCRSPRFIALLNLGHSIARLTHPRPPV